MLPLFAEHVFGKITWRPSMIHPATNHSGVLFFFSWGRSWSVRASLALLWRRKEGQTQWPQHFNYRHWLCIQTVKEERLDWMARHPRFLQFIYLYIVYNPGFYNTLRNSLAKLEMYTMFHLQQNIVPQSLKTFNIWHLTSNRSLKLEFSYCFLLAHYHYTNNFIK